MNRKMFYHLPGDLSRLMQLAGEIRQLDEYLELSGRTRYILDLALEEMATNIIKYGYDEDSRERVIEVEITFGQEYILLELRDDGKPFDPLNAPPARLEGNVEEREIGGVGIHLVKQLVPDMAYRRSENRNLLTLQIRREREPRT